MALRRLRTNHVREEVRGAKGDKAASQLVRPADPTVLPAYSTAAAPVVGSVLGTLTTPFEVRDPEIPT